MRMTSFAAPVAIAGLGMTCYAIFKRQSLQATSNNNDYASYVRKILSADTEESSEQSEHDNNDDVASTFFASLDTTSIRAEKEPCRDGNQQKEFELIPTRRASKSLHELSSIPPCSISCSRITTTDSSESLASDGRKLIPRSLSTSETYLKSKLDIIARREGVYHGLNAALWSSSCTFSITSNVSNGSKVHHFEITCKNKHEDGTICPIVKNAITASRSSATLYMKSFSANVDKKRAQGVVTGPNGDGFFVSFDESSHRSQNSGNLRCLLSDPGIAHRISTSSLSTSDALLDASSSHYPHFDAVDNTDSDSGSSDVSVVTALPSKTSSRESNHTSSSIGTEHFDDLAQTEHGDPTSILEVPGSSSNICCSGDQGLKNVFFRTGLAEDHLSGLNSVESILSRNELARTAASAFQVLLPPTGFSSSYTSDNDLNSSSSGSRRRLVVSASCKELNQFHQFIVDEILAEELSKLESEVRQLSLPDIRYTTTRHRFDTKWLEPFQKLMWRICPQVGTSSVLIILLVSYSLICFLFWLREVYMDLPVGSASAKMASSLHDHWLW